MTTPGELRASIEGLGEEMPERWVVISMVVVQKLFTPSF
jgi:hypothetical protein